MTRIFNFLLFMSKLLTHVDIGYAYFFSKARFGLIRKFDIFL